LLQIYRQESKRLGTAGKLDAEIYPKDRLKISITPKEITPVKRYIPT